MRIISIVFNKIYSIMRVLIIGAAFAAIPAIIMYGGNQTSLSRIKKYGAESSQGIEALKIANGINIVCGIILAIIGIIVLICIVSVLFGKLSIKKNYSGYAGEYTNDYGNTSGNSFDFDMKTTYIKDQYGNVTGTAKTVSYIDKYGGYKSTEVRDNLGNKQGEIKTHKW